MAVFPDTVCERQLTCECFSFNAGNWNITNITFRAFSFRGCPSHLQTHTLILCCHPVAILGIVEPENTFKEETDPGTNRIVTFRDRRSLRIHLGEHFVNKEVDT